MRIIFQYEAIILFQCWNKIHSSQEECWMLVCLSTAGISLIKCLNVFVFGRSIIEPKAPHQLLTKIMSDTQVENALVQVAH